MQCAQYTTTYTYCGTKYMCSFSVLEYGILPLARTASVLYIPNTGRGTVLIGNHLLDATYVIQYKFPTYTSLYYCNSNSLLLQSIHMTIQQD